MHRLHRTSLAGQAAAQPVWRGAMLHQRAGGDRVAGMLAAAPAFICSLPALPAAVPQRARPADAEQQLLALLQQFKEARAAWDEQCAAAAEDGQEAQQEGLELEDGDEEQVCPGRRCAL